MLISFRKIIICSGSFDGSIMLCLTTTGLKTYSSVNINVIFTIIFTTHYSKILQIAV